MIIDNVHDRRNGFVGSWEAEPLVYYELHPSDVGRTVIYKNGVTVEAGTLESWCGGRVYVRYSTGETAAGADPTNLSFGIQQLKELDDGRETLKRRG
jgi:hypothetical protein